MSVCIYVDLYSCLKQNSSINNGSDKVQKCLPNLPIFTPFSSPGKVYYDNGNDEQCQKAKGQSQNESQIIFYLRSCNGIGW